MKRIALAVLLALCGARVYGVDPVEQPKEITQAQINELQAALKDTRNIDAIADQLGLPKAEFKGWFSRHKTAVISSIVGLATYGTACGLGKWAKGTQQSDGQFPGGTWKTREFCAKLACLYGPLVWMKNKAGDGMGWANDHRWTTAGITLAVILVSALIYELYHGKDSAVEEAQLVAALAAAEATPVPAKAEEVVAPVVVAAVENKVEEVTPVVTPVENKVEEVVSVVETPAQTKAEEVVVPVVVAAVENKVEEVTPVVTPVENKVEEVVSVVETPAQTKVEEVVMPVVVAAVENKVEEVTPVVTPVENKVEEVVSVVETPAQTKVEEVVVPVVVAAVENKVEEVPAIAAAA